MPTDLLAPSDFGRLCELEYSSNKWHRVVMAPFTADDYDIEIFFVNEKNTMHITHDEAEGMLRPKGGLKWSDADLKKAMRTVETESWDVEEEGMVEDDQSAAAPAQKARTKQPSAAAKLAAASSGRPAKRGAASKAEATFTKVDSGASEASDDEMEEIPKRTKGSGGSKTKAKAAASRAASARGGGKRKAPAESDDDADGADGADDDDDDEYDDDDSDSDGGGARARKSKPAAAKKAAASRAAASAAKPKGVGKTTWPFEKKKVARPKKQPSQPFVDPAGLDIEDRGVEWIVERQCEALEPLLLDALEHGELKLSMATACSGTDAPVVAMIVAKEMLERKGVSFDFTHTMSCELEPYKQSFIARNHPEVSSNRISCVPPTHLLISPVHLMSISHALASRPPSMISSDLLRPHQIS